MLKISRVLIGAITATALVLTGCSSASETSGGEQQVTVAVGIQSFESFDPQMSASPPTDAVTRLIYEGLVGPAADGSIKPLLAEEWTNPEPQVWLFTLREGVTFHDGTAVTADAVASSFTQILDPTAQKTRNSEFARVETVTATDARTVRFDLASPWPSLLNTLAYSAGAIVSPSISSGEVDPATTPVGTGPYQLDSITDQEVTLTANAEYWGTKAAVPTIKFVPVSAETTRVQMLKSGQADIITDVPTSQLAGLKQNSDIQVVSAPGGLVMHVGLNALYEPLQDIKVRQALNYAIDRDAIIKTTLSGEAEPALSYLAPSTDGYAKATTPYGYDPERAKELLAEAGYEEGFELELTTPSGRYPMAAEVAQAIQGYLAKVGVDVKISTIDFGAEIDAITRPEGENKVQSYLLGWQAATGEPGLVSDIVFMSSATPPNSWNTMFYSNPKVDAAVTEAAVTIEDADRYALYQEAQELVYADAPWLFLYVPNNLVGAKAGLGGVNTLPDGTLMLHELS